MFGHNFPEKDKGVLAKEGLTDQHYFMFLDMLRDSGKTNMAGAPAYLEHYYGLDRYEAKRIWLAWVDAINAKLKMEAYLLDDQ